MNDRKCGRLKPEAGDSSESETAGIMNRIRVLVVDDEPPARRKLIGFLNDEDGIEVVGQAGDGEQAVQAVYSLRPDAVFLDIQMPGMNGFQVLEELKGDSLPQIVFVTAYDQYALQAFEVCALDYLLKPFDRPRFRAALSRLREQLDRPSAQNLQIRLERLLSQVEERRPRYQTRFMVKTSNRVVFLRAEQIDWIEASANYVELHLGPKSYLLRETMNRLEERLDPSRFVRVHRSRIVNIDRVRELHPFSRNDYILILEDGTRIKMSRRYKDQLDEAMRS